MLERGIIMINRIKKNAGISLLVSVLLLSLLISGCAKFNMVNKETKPTLLVKRSKAVLVIVRSTLFNSGDIISNYLDGKMIGQTQTRSYFITEVKPGMHYLTAKASNKDTARIHFEAKKIYFLEQGVFPGYSSSTTRFSPLQLQDALAQINDAAYIVYETKDPSNDMTDKEFQDAKKDYEKEIKEDPASHYDVRQYKGLSRVQ
jgi:hypothetical protein